MKRILLTTAALALLAFSIAAAEPRPQGCGTTQPRPQGSGIGKQARAVLPSSHNSPPSVVAGLPTEPPACIYAVVRVGSHGGSATVIQTTTGKSYLLSCAHCFEGGMISKPISLDVPTKKRKSNQAQCQLLDIDYQADLSLLELEDGPLDFVAPVAAEPHRPGRNLLSIGYDNMQTPATVKPATITATDQDRTFTKERPWHGRSGGALLDAETGETVGVVSGYETLPWGRGIYVSHQAIVSFLNRSHTAPKPRQQPTPQWNPFPQIFRQK
jgi:hypothetical protein